MGSLPPIKTDHHYIIENIVEHGEKFQINKIKPCFCTKALKMFQTDLYSLNYTLFLDMEQKL
jgi:hypothetical protein